MQINEVPNAKVGIVAGSKSDQETVDKITAVLDQFGITWEYNILSAHRTPNATAKYAREAAGRGLQVLIGVAGLAAALPTASMLCTPSCRCPRESRWQQSASATARMPVSSLSTSSPSLTQASAKSSLLTARASGISKAKPSNSELKTLAFRQRFLLFCHSLFDFTHM